MQYVIIIAVVAVIILVLGVSVQMIASVSAWAIMLVCTLVSALMAVFFVVFLAKMLACKRKKGVFLRADFKDRGAFKKYKSAVYDIEGEEHFNIFPYDLKIFYKKDKLTELYLDKKGEVYDTMTRITIYAGVMLSLAMTALMAWVTVFYYNNR